MHCQQWVDERIILSQREIHTAQQSANEETKSSAGDKYETGRAMAQLEIEKNATQLAEANKLKQLLNEFSSESFCEKVRLGSLIETDKGWFYLSISAGVISLDSVNYICLSPASPLGSKLMGKEAAQNFEFNGQYFSIKAVF